MTVASLRIKDDEFALLNEFLTANLGLMFPDHKREVLESRLRPRLESLNLRSFLDYYLVLQYETNGRRELKECTRLVTNNETYFFRETYQFDALFERALEGVKETATDSRKLRFLSAGCSSGEEPHTLNMYVRENQYRMLGTDVEIDAFDVSEPRIEIARSGQYGTSSMRGVSPDQIEKYFQVLPNDTWRVKQMYRNGVNFRIGNLLHPEAYGAPSAYDVIFCRNVLIYFSDETIRQVLERFAVALREGGILFLGHSESVIGMSSSFEPVRVGNCIAYKRMPHRSGP